MQANDSLDQFTRSRHILDGPASVRERDAAMEHFARQTAEKPVDNTYREWPQPNQCGPTKAFKPNGSFQSLRESGKFSDGQVELNEHLKTPYLIPGYTGFIRGRQHISGRPYGETTRRAIDTGYREHVCTSPIPSDPQHNRRIPHAKLEDSFMYGIVQEKANHIPGYTGHVPGVRAQYSNTYGSTTREQIKVFHDQHPRPHPQEADGYAYTSFPRQFLHIDSAPVSGAPHTNRAPVKLIPRKLEHLHFFAT